MDGITDKTILLVFCCLLLNGKGSEAVITFLIAVIAGTLGTYIEEKRILYPLFLAVLLMAAAWPGILFFFPVFLYDIVFKKAYIAALPLLLAFFEPARREPGQGNLGACCSTCYNPSL